jgi:hypothetical protein
MKRRTFFGVVAGALGGVFVRPKSKKYPLIGPGHPDYVDMTEPTTAKLPMHIFTTTEPYIWSFCVGEKHRFRYRHFECAIEVSEMPEDYIKFHVYDTVKEVRSIAEHPVDMGFGDLCEVWKPFIAGAGHTFESYLRKPKHNKCEFQRYEISMYSST